MSIGFCNCGVASCRVGAPSAPIKAAADTASAMPGPCMQHNAFKQYARMTRPLRRINAIPMCTIESLTSGCTLGVEWHVLQHFPT